MTGRRRRVPAIGCRRRGERGLALIAVLWISALLAVIATALATGARQDLRLARNLAAEATASARAEGALQLAGGALLLERRGAHEAARALLADPWMNGLRLEVHDTAGRIDPDAAPRELLLGLLAALEVDRLQAETLVARLLARRGADAEEDEGAFTEEDDDGGSLAFATPPETRGRSFQRLEELGRLPGVTPALYARLAPHLTVNSGAARIDPWAATAVVLQALPDVNPAEREIFLAARSREAALPPQQRRARLDSLYTDDSPQRVFDISLQVAEGEGRGFRREATLRLTDDPRRPLLLHRWERGGR